VIIDATDSEIKLNLRRSFFVLEIIGTPSTHAPTKEARREKMAVEETTDMTQ
jgi:hypothetical protein